MQHLSSLGILGIKDALSVEWLDNGIFFAHEQPSIPRFTFGLNDNAISTCSPGFPAMLT
jgi:hypothetical protein